jgi:hypothetical protein
MSPRPEVAYSGNTILGGSPSAGFAPGWTDPIDTSSGSDPLSASAGESSELELPSLLQALFGFDFLPLGRGCDRQMQHESGVGDSIQEFEMDDVSISDEHEVFTNLGTDYDEIGDGSANNDVLEQSRQGKRRMLKGQRFKKAIVHIKSKVQEVNDKRKDKRRDRISSLDDEVQTSSNHKLQLMSPKSGPRKRSNSSGAVPNADVAWAQAQHIKLDEYRMQLSSIQSETEMVQSRAQDISSRVQQAQFEIAELEQRLVLSMRTIQLDTATLSTIKKQLTVLEQRRDHAQKAVNNTAAVIKRGTDIVLRNAEKQNSPQVSPFPLPPRPRCQSPSNFTKGYVDDSSEVNRPRSLSTPNLRVSASLSFIRVHDLDLQINVSGPEIGSSMHSNSDSKLSQVGPVLESKTRDARELFFIDHDIKTVLDALTQVGYAIATDESGRFVPVQNTAGLLAKSRPPVDPSWPVQPWQSVGGSDTLVWIGNAGHKGPGHDLPVVKARGNIPAAPRKVIGLIMDSSRVKEYNKMAQGRKDLVVLQEGIDTPRQGSDHCIAGEAKIVQSLNKPPLIRRSIEMLSLLHARKLDGSGNAGHSYIAVSRSVWEDAAGTTKESKDSVRGEMLLGVNLLRAIPGSKEDEIHCELTTISHVHTTAVPQMLAQKMAPQHAVNFINSIRSLF